ncbi:hypothetical protein KHS38_06045 [Mucilaginibacter sp. Bleaf8]|uniref:hypothetical protein n=1 Tax=Mucilaginibacter sp. Bleaf8 TaxID=2834430 RepID=UPI001BD08564|nr:hypothetical protein [Mucilaginibacter sp. Bleaf8]MBS7563960.1 hypothetical protein [Mucilaginibacter sp. Bleaf8]
MKKILITLLICSASVLAKAQIGWNYAQYDFGVSGALNYAYTDAETVNGAAGLNLNLTYNYTPFINYIAEVQYGRLKGGDHQRTLSGREFNNQYTAVSLRAQLQAGELLDYAHDGFTNALKNFYISAGVGAIYNNMKEIYRNSLYVPGYTSTGRNTSTELFIPLKAGYEIKIYNNYDEPSVKLDFGYQYNPVFGDQLDGIKAGKRNDSFSQFVVGIKFAIGGITSYRKQISRYQP